MLAVRVMAPPEDTAEASVVKVRPLVSSQHWLLDCDAPPGGSFGGYPGAQQGYQGGYTGYQQQPGSGYGY